MVVSRDGLAQMILRPAPPRWWLPDVSGKAPCLSSPFSASGTDLLAAGMQKFHSLAESAARLLQHAARTKPDICALTERIRWLSQILSPVELVLVLGSDAFSFLQKFLACRPCQEFGG